MKKCMKEGKSVGGKRHGLVAFIPVRGGSKSIPLKNIKEFCGQPLVYWTVKAASETEAVDTVYVATDDELIKKTVDGFNLPKVCVIPRGSHTATDTATTESAMLDFADNYEFDHVILIQATSPLLESADLAGGIIKYFSAGADSLLSVVRQKRFIWQSEGVFASPQNYNLAERPRRQEWDGYFVENGAFYITSKKRLLASQVRISGRVSVYEMPEETFFEIDEPSDWLIAEQLKKSVLQNDLSNIDFKNINLLITDVDGVLTDAGMYYSVHGDELKKFNARDGKGIELIKAQGIKVMFLTSENIDLVRKRAEKLKIDYLYMGVVNKKERLEKFFAQNPEHCFARTAYIGDDINDLECIGLAALSAVPADGLPEVKESALYKCSLAGGHGCVREFCDLILGRRKNG